MFKKILVTLDGSELSEAVLPHVQTLATATGAQVVLLRVVPILTTIPTYLTMVPTPVAYTPPPPAPELDLRSQAEGYLQRIAMDYFPDRVVAQEVYAGPTADSILEFAEQARVDLIAMTTHGRSGLSRLMLGSVADEIVRRAQAPVLLVRPPHK
jgi:nucleotide-binding universal stress UspA family protein